MREVIRPLVDRALGSGAAEGWFFIRYADPTWHLRLRFRGDPVRLHGEVLPLLQEAVAPLLESGRVRRLALDTYERELERYGGPIGMPLCEALFQADSAAVWDYCKPGAPAPALELSNGGLAPFGGGVPLRNAGGELIGAVGVSGGAVAQDTEIARAAALAGA